MAWMIPPTNTWFQSALGAEWTVSNATISRETEPGFAPSGYSCRVVWNGVGSDPCVVYTPSDLIAFVGDTNIIGAWIFSPTAAPARIRLGWNEHDSGGGYLRTRQFAMDAPLTGWNFITCTSVIGASTRFIKPFYGRGTPTTATCWVGGIGIPQTYPAIDPALSHVQGHVRR